jgi:hypothetical protein
MGELSQDLEKAETLGQSGEVRLPINGKQAKGDVLRVAGLSTSTAHRYESLAGDPRARTAAAEATDAPR